MFWNLVFSWLGHPSRHRRCSASWRLQCLQLQDVLRWLSTNPSAPEPGNKRTCRAGNPWNPEFARSTIRCIKNKCKYHIAFNVVAYHAISYCIMLYIIRVLTILSCTALQYMQYHIVIYLTYYRIFKNITLRFTISYHVVYHIISCHIISY